MNASKKMADDQRAADRAHHQERVAWLESSDEPTWSDGVPVSKYLRHEMLRLSRNYLATGEGLGHCQCEPRCGAAA